jgi:hypothetical protein
MSVDNFDITLMNEKKEFVTTYRWYIAPSIGDSLFLSETSMFLVKERLLPTTNSNRVVLIGELIDAVIV